MAPEPLSPRGDSQCSAPRLDSAGSARRAGIRGCWRASPVSVSAFTGEGPGCASSHEAAAKTTAGARGRGRATPRTPAREPQLQGRAARIFQPLSSPSYCGRAPLGTESQPCASPGRIPGLTAGRGSRCSRGPWRWRGGAASWGAAAGSAEPPAPPASVIRPPQPSGHRPGPRGSRVPSQVSAGAGLPESTQCPRGGEPRVARGWVGKGRVNRRKIQESPG